MNITPFEGFQYLKFTGLQGPFPTHYHDTFCISLIGAGTEIIQLGDARLYSLAGEISITHPYEVHANPLLSAGIQTTFSTLYLTQERVDQALGHNGVAFQHKQLTTDSMRSAFARVLAVIQKKDENSLQTAIRKLLTQFTTVSVSKLESQLVDTERWQFVTDYIDAHLEKKLSLEVLAGQAGVSKYHFARSFKQYLGISPINYVLMRKAFAAKNSILPDSYLTSTGYDFGFADQAHFSRTFKRFVGLSPQAYQRQLTTGC